MSEVDATLAGEKSPDYWEGYRKCLDDQERDKDYDAEFKRQQRIDRLVSLAAGICQRYGLPCGEGDKAPGWFNGIAKDANTLLAAIERLEGGHE